MIYMDSRYFVYEVIAEHKAKIGIISHKSVQHDAGILTPNRER